MRRRYVTEQDARSRNLLISIARGAIMARSFAPTYSKRDIAEQFYFSQGDLKYQSGSFFHQDGEVYILKDEIHLYLEKVIAAHNSALSDLEEAESVFIRQFGRYDDKWRKNFSTDYTEMRRICREMGDIIPILHWGRLPILSKYLMINSNLIPEENLAEFYSDNDMLHAMLQNIRGEGESMELNGDQTLNIEMNFSVYSRRWKYEDTYRVWRTVDGWELRHIAINGKCEKDGSGALLKNLQHDSVFYPEEGIKYAMSKLWEQADEGNLSIEELQDKLQQIADWISTVEKAVGAGQPNWVGYY